MKYTRGARALAFGATLAALTCASPVVRADEPTPAPAADDPQMAEARRQFQAGVNLLDDPDGARYEEAYHAFLKAYELSKSPKVLGNIGFCSMKLERDGEAIDAYAAYLRDSKDIDPRERAQIERDLATISSTVATFKATLKTPVGANAMLVDTREQTRGAPIVNSYPMTGTELSVRLRPGRHAFKVKGDDGESIVHEVTLEPASSKTHEFTFAPKVVAAPRDAVAPRSRPSYAGPVILGIVGLAGIGTGVATGLMARGKTDDIEAQCPGNLCPSSYDFRSDRTQAKTFGTIADISFISGGALLGGALVWALLVPSSGAPKTPKTGSTATAWLPNAGCSAKGCSVQFGGAF